MKELMDTIALSLGITEIFDGFRGSCPDTAEKSPYITFSSGHRKPEGYSLPAVHFKAHDSKAETLKGLINFIQDNPDKTTLVWRRYPETTIEKQYVGIDGSTRTLWKTTCRLSLVPHGTELREYTD